ncbi:MAG: PfkB family carbohydrate kinase [Xanthobacteraceae bacterium]
MPRAGTGMTGAPAPRILCAGMAVLDEVFRVERVPAANTKTRAGAFASVVGGCAANAAVAIARLGGAAELAAVLGEAGHDEVGDRILSRLAREGVRCSGMVRVAKASSTISAILVDAAGDRMIATHCDERLFAAAVEDPRALVASVDAVLADNWLPDLVVPICAAARERGRPVIIDGDGPMGETDALVGLATHIVFSADALRATSGRDDLGAALAHMSGHARGFLAVTNGADDILWWDDGAPQRLPVFAVEAVDTLAAGDVFHGAFALALAEGRRGTDALRFAAAAAALKCTRFGGGSAAPTRAEVEALLASAARLGP